MYKLFLAIRYLLKRRIALFAIVGVWLCSAMVLIVISVMGGFLDMITQRSRGLLSDLVVKNESYQGFPYYQEFIEKCRTDLPDDIEVATPTIASFGVLRASDTEYTKPVQIVGIQFDDYCRVNTFEKGLYYNRYYPGTTTLAPQQQPVLGMKSMILPLLEARKVLPERYRKLIDDLRREPRNEQRYVDLAKSWYDVKRGCSISVSFVDEQFLDEKDRDKNTLFVTIQEDYLPDRFANAFREFARNTENANALDELRSTYKSPTGAGEFITLFDDSSPREMGEPADGIIIGIEMIADRNKLGEYERYLEIGHEWILSVIPMTVQGTLSAEGVITKRLRYADDSYTRVYDIDRITSYVDFDMLQNLLRMGPLELEGGGFLSARASEIHLKLKPGVDLEEAKTRVEELWKAFYSSIEPTLHPIEKNALNIVKVETWQDRQKPYIKPVEKEKGLVVILFSLISLVAIVLIGCIFYMIVVQKTRDIGIIKSIGASARGVAMIFILYSIVVGLIGATLGTITGTLFVHHINEIQAMLGLQVWDPRVYAFDNIPGTVKTTEAVMIFVVSVLASVVGAVIPAIHAARVWPVKTLRHEN